MNKTHKGTFDGAVYALHTTDTWPYGDDLIQAKTTYDKVQEVLLKANFDNEYSKSFGDTPWGGHSNEVFYAQ